MYFLYFSHLYMYRPMEKTLAPNSKVIFQIFTTPYYACQLKMEGCYCSDNYNNKAELGRGFTGEEVVLIWIAWRL